MYITSRLGVNASGAGNAWNRHFESPNEDLEAQTPPFISRHRLLRGVECLHKSHTSTGRIFLPSFFFFNAPGLLTEGGVILQAIKNTSNQ